MDKDSDGKVSLAEFKGKREGDKATKAEATFKARTRTATASWLSKNSRPVARRKKNK